MASMQTEVDKVWGKDTPQRMLWEQQLKRSQIKRDKWNEVASINY